MTPAIKTPDQLPSQRHFAALVFKTHSIRHEGDERSLTNPGHGYPAYTETIHAVSASVSFKEATP